MLRISNHYMLTIAFLNLTSAMLRKTAVKIAIPKKGSAFWRVSVHGDLDRVGMMLPARDSPDAREAPLGSFRGLLGSVCPYFDFLLRRLERMSVGAEHVLEKRYDVLGHNLTAAKPPLQHCPRTLMPKYRSCLDLSQGPAADYPLALTWINQPQVIRRDPFKSNRTQRAPCIMEALRRKIEQRAYALSECAGFQAEPGSWPAAAPHLMQPRQL